MSGAGASAAAAAASDTAGEASLSTGQQLRKDLQLHRKYPVAAAFIEANSQLYLNETKDDEEGTIIAEYIKGDETALPKVMRLAELAAALAKDKEPDRFAIVLGLTLSFTPQAVAQDATTRKAAWRRS
jgi:hypothetical protein